MALVCAFCYTAISEEEIYHRCPQDYLSFHVGHSCPGHPGVAMIIEDPADPAGATWETTQGGSSSLVCACCYTAIPGGETYYQCPEDRLSFLAGHRCPEHFASTMVPVDPTHPQRVAWARDPTTPQQPRAPSPPYPSPRSTARAGVGGLIIVAGLTLALGLGAIVVSFVNSPAGQPNNGQKNPSGAVASSPTPTPSSVRMSTPSVIPSPLGTPEIPARNAREAQAQFKTMVEPGAIVEPSPVPMVTLGTITTCSVVSGWRSFQAKQTFTRGETLCVYADALGGDHPGRTGVTFLFEIHSQLGTAVLSQRQTGIPAGTSDAYAHLNARILESWEPGRYGVRVTITDDLSGMQKAGTTSFTIVAPPEPPPIRAAQTDTTTIPGNPVRPAVTSGSITWEGILAQETEITFNGSRVNVGSVSGGLPGVRSRITVSSKLNVDSISFAEGLGVTNFSTMVIRIKPKKVGQPVRLTLLWQIY